MRGDGRPKRTRQRAAARAEAARPALSKVSREAVQDALGYRFKDAALLTRALTHPSALEPHDMAAHANQRLEFLGDRVLGLVVATRLHERYPTEREGTLSGRLHRLVNKAACARAVRPLGLGDHILMDDAERRSGGATRESMLGDVCEAVIGAIYLDSGLMAARRFIEHAWEGQWNADPLTLKSPKTQLQEHVHGIGLAAPRYETMDRSGPDHAPIFVMAAVLEDGRRATGQGKSKQDAEKQAALALLETLQEDT